MKLLRYDSKSFVSPATLNLNVLRILSNLRMPSSFLISYIIFYEVYQPCTTATMTMAVVVVTIHACNCDNTV